MNFQDRITLAFEREKNRRQAEGEPRLTKTELWKGVGASSGAATHWFDGSNGMDLATCMKAAPILRVNPFWLYDESQAIDQPTTGKAVLSEVQRKPEDKLSTKETLEIIELMSQLDSRGRENVLDLARSAVRLKNARQSKVVDDQG